MGWTYDIVAFAPNEKPTWDVAVNADDVHAISLAGDVFDRECLGGWLGLTKDDVIEDQFYRVSLPQVEKAIGVLQGLVDKVASMPYDAEDPNCVTGKYYGSYEDEQETYHGTPNNIKIYKEVEAVLARPYHFRFPWTVDKEIEKCKSEGRELPSWYKMGVPEMVETLKHVKRHMLEHPDWSYVTVCY